MLLEDNTDLVKMRVGLCRVAQLLKLGHYIPVPKNALNDGVSGEKGSGWDLEQLKILAFSTQDGWEKLLAIILSFLEDRRSKPPKAAKMSAFVRDTCQTLPSHTANKFCTRCDNFHETISCHVKGK
jgi:hypothetical protein